MIFLDHFGTWWVVHRPLPEMSRKQAVMISTAAGGGMKSTVKDMTDSLELWGLRKVYRMGFGVQAVKPDEIPERILKRIHRKIDCLAGKIQKNAGKTGYNRRAKKWFYLMLAAHKQFPPPNRIMAIGKSGAGMGTVDRGIVDNDGFSSHGLMKQETA